MVGSLVSDGGGAGRTDDEQGSLLQLQRHSFDAKAAVPRHCSALSACGSDLALLGVRSGSHGFRVRSGWVDIACGTFLSAPPGFADCMIHAFDRTRIPPNYDRKRIFAAQNRAEISAGREQVRRLGFSIAR